MVRRIVKRILPSELGLLLQDELLLSLVGLSAPARGEVEAALANADQMGVILPDELDQLREGSVLRRRRLKKR